MSKAAITKVVQRAISDAGFRRQLSQDPTGALRGFDLSADETAALRAGDAGRLAALGVDQRMSKAFVLGGASIAATRQAGTDLSGAGLNADADGGLSSGSLGNALVSGDDASAALIDDGTAAGRTVIPTDPGGNLTADVDGAAGTSNADVDDSSDAYLTKVGYDSGAAANADVEGAVDTTNAFIDDSEAYLTKISDDADAADATHATWGGDENAGPSGDLDSAAEGPTINDDGSSLTP